LQQKKNLIRTYNSTSSNVIESCATKNAPNRNKAAKLKNITEFVKAKNMPNKCPRFIDELKYNKK